MSDPDWRERVAAVFPAWGDGTWRADDWQAARDRLRVGDTVTGTVIARAEFGAWVDLGVGFAALMLITQIAELTPENYRSGAWCPVGTEVRATIQGMNAGKIALTQKPLVLGASEPTNAHAHAHAWIVLWTADVGGRTAEIPLATSRWRRVFPFKRNATDHHAFELALDIRESPLVPGASPRLIPLRFLDDVPWPQFRPGTVLTLWDGRPIGTAEIESLEPG